MSPEAPEADTAAPLSVRLLLPLHRFIWRSPSRRARKLLTFAETEAEGGRDLSLAAERTDDGILRRLYLRHAIDEQRHARLFRHRGRELLAHAGRRAATFQANFLAPGERGLDDLRVEAMREERLLAFLHLSEKAAAGRFSVYRDALATDPETRRLFETILRDEAFHMSYTHTQLKRRAPHRYGIALWRARASRVWKAYLRLAMGIAGLLGGLFLLVQYFLVLPLFALLAKRAARREAVGWRPVMRRTGELARRSQF